MQAIATTKKTLHDMSIEYIQCFLMIIKKRTPSFSSFLSSFVSPVISNDLNIQVVMREKFMNIDRVDDVVWTQV